MPAIANSLKYSSVATVVDLVLGVAIAYVVVRTRLAGRQVLDFLSMLPLAVPGLVLAFGYLAMSQEGHALAFLNPVQNPTALLIIAYAVRRLPYVVRSAAAGFQQTSETLEEAAQNLGCPPVKATIRVTLPLITANLIAGGLLAFSFAMLEVSDSLILAQKQVYLPDHQGHLRTVPAPGRRPVPRLRPRGVGDGLSRRDHRRHERPAGPEARGDFQSLTGSRRAAADRASTPAPSAAVNRK